MIGMKTKISKPTMSLSWVLIVQLCTLFTVEWNPAKILILTTNLDICLYCNNFLLQRECYPEWFCNKYIFYYKINESQLMDSCMHLTFHFICWVYLYLQFIFFRDLQYFSLLFYRKFHQFVKVWCCVYGGGGGLAHIDANFFAVQRS